MWANTAQQCRLGLFQNSGFAGDLEDSNRLLVESCASLAVTRLFPISGCETEVSHSSTESEIISLDAGLRMDGIPAFDLWDLVTEVLHSPSNQVQGHQERAW